MPRFHVALLAAALIPSLAMGQLPPATWRAEQTTMQVWSSTGYSRSQDRAVISCVNKSDYDAEIMVEVSAGRSSTLFSARQAQATPQGSQSSIALLSITSSEQSGNILR